MVKPRMSVDTDAIINTKVFKEHIGYFSASMTGYSEDAIFKLSHSMKGHGVYMHKSNENPADDWWFFLLPQGSTRTPNGQSSGGISRYTIRLPDEFTFTLEQGPLTREGFFTSPIRINLIIVELKKRWGNGKDIPQFPVLHKLSVSLSRCDIM